MVPCRSSRWSLADWVKVGVQNFKLKKNIVDVVVKHKVCLIAKVYMQREGIDFEEVFAPIV